VPQVVIEDHAMIRGFVDKLLQGIVTLQHLSGYCNNAFSVTSCFALLGSSHAQ
jgi:hypothetical protein